MDKYSARAVNQSFRSDMPMWGMRLRMESSFERQSFILKSTSIADLYAHVFDRGTRDGRDLMRELLELKSFGEP